jgi:GNAT superfamily N-acetyltransferase
MEIALAQSPADYALARQLIEEYAAALGVDLCFQDLAWELDHLAAMYGPPGGCLLLAKDGPSATGCVALRDRGAGVCEMKRLYVRPDHRGTGLGRRLAKEVIQQGQRLGHRRMVLDTLPSMVSARALYDAIGFVPTAPYYANPLEGADYLALELTPPAHGTGQRSPGARNVRDSCAPHRTGAVRARCGWG